MAEAGYFASRCKGPQGRRKIAGRSHWRPGPLAVRSPSRRPGSRLSGIGPPPATELSTLIGAKRRLNDSGRQEQEAGDVLRCKLNPQRCSEGIEAKDVQILVEIAQPR